MPAMKTLPLALCGYFAVKTCLVTEVKQRHLAHIDLFGARINVSVPIPALDAGYKRGRDTVKTPHQKTIPFALSFEARATTGFRSCMNENVVMASPL
ncbi:hypothetical protein GM676_29910 [Duganella radicis]|uniref:Uncharacterized protein n=2 Tax=Duganella radicis TaxID=551988 RepID=A0A6L6PU44_9BURK|nr:hypothetical protein [Duganella radicis]